LELLKKPLLPLIKKFLVSYDVRLYRLYPFCCIDPTNRFENLLVFFQHYEQNIGQLVFFQQLRRV
jgi:hypothetical protein